MKLSSISQTLGRIFGPIGRIPPRQKIIYSILLVFVLAVGIRFFLWGKLFADLEPANGVINNQVAVTYLDSNGHQRDISSNTLVTTSSPVVATKPTNPEFTFSKAGWYMISIPGSLATTDPRTFFRYGQSGGIDIDEGLVRMNTATQQLQIWSSQSPATFGQLATGESYWIQIDKAEAGRMVSNVGAPFTTPRVVSLVNQASKGWVLIGNPFNYKTNVATKFSFYLKDSPGNKFTFAQAAEKSWIEATMYSWDGSTQSLVDVCPEAFWCSTEELLPWSGAWLRLLRKDLMLEIAP